VAEILGKYQFMEGSWKMPEKSHIKVNIDGVIHNFHADGLKMADLSEAISKAKTAFDNLMKGFTGLSPHPDIVKVTEYLAQCAARVYGENGVEYDCVSDIKTMTHVFCVIARRNNSSSRFVFKVVDEFFEGKELEDVFFEILPQMCKQFDSQIPLQFIIPSSVKKLMAHKDDSPFDLTFNYTTDSYKFLTESDKLDKLMRTWKYPVEARPSLVKSGLWLDVPKSNYLSEWMAKDKFATGGLVSAPLGESQLGDSGRLMYSICPALGEHVKYPCGCKSVMGLGVAKSGSLQSAIIHLNDADTHEGINKEWTREEIADWLESLDLDLSLKDNGNNLEMEEDDDG
jgi:hypothetical protein